MSISQYPPPSGSPLPAPDRPPAPVGSAEYRSSFAAQGPGMGRLRHAYNSARRQGDQQAVASLWLGTGALTCCVLAVGAKISALYWISLLAAVPAITTARFARQRGKAAANADLVYLSRYGQICGWIVVGLFILVVLFIAVLLGAFFGTASH